MKEAGVLDFEEEDEWRIYSLAKYYTVTRYPDAANGPPSESVGREKAVMAVTTARRALEYVRQLLQGENQEGAT